MCDFTVSSSILNFFEYLIMIIIIIIIVKIIMIIIYMKTSLDSDWLRAM